MSRSRSIAISALSLLAVTGAASADIFNFDFSAGNSGFYSNYNYATRGDSAASPGTTLYSEGTYGITNFDTLHPSFADFYDHTSGRTSGTADANANFMIVNGTTRGGGPSWGNDVTLPAGAYSLSGFFASLVTASPASLEFRVLSADGNTIIARNFPQTFNAPGSVTSPVGTWVQNSLVFNIAASATYRIQVWDLSQVAGGNDYAIDDIRLTSVVPLPPAAFAGLSSLAGVGALAAIRRKRLARA